MGRQKSSGSQALNWETSFLRSLMLIGSLQRLNQPSCPDESFSIRSRGPSALLPGLETAASQRFRIETTSPQRAQKEKAALHTGGPSLMEKIEEKRYNSLGFSPKLALFYQFQVLSVNVHVA